MLKKSAIATAAVLAFVGLAHAATTEINMYGSSAQYLFWIDAADDFLRGPLKCSNVRQAQTSDGKHAITLGDNCINIGGDNVILRYSAKASYEGIRPLIGTAPVTPEGCESYFLRKMADETTISGNSVGGTRCVDVTIGVSDVAGESFTQCSSGQKYGPNGGGVINPVFDGEPFVYPFAQPLVVPFGFFVNKSVTMQKCVGGSSDGEMCASGADCPSGTCETKPLDNISREMAVMIFSGQAWYWSDFGTGFPADPIVACLRHAGSGTAAAFDYAVMKGNGWGANLVTEENAGDPTIWFNEGSSDLMKCINQLPGAIGYANADQLEGDGATKFPNVSAVKYNGFKPTRVNIRNGLYDFWTNQWMYMSPSEPTKVKNIFNSLVSFASNPAKVPTTKAKYWATADEMVYKKASDAAYPAYRGANLPQTP